MADQGGGSGGFGGITWAQIAQWLGLAAGGGGVAVAAGKLLDKLWPPASERLADNARRRKERADRITELEESLEELTDRLLAEREAHLQTKGSLMKRDVELQLLRGSLSGPVVVLPPGTVAVTPADTVQRDGSEGGEKP